MPDPALVSTRRGALAGLLAMVAASACDVDDLRPPDDKGPASAGPSGSPEPDSDQLLVDGVAIAIVGALDLVGLVRRRFPELDQSTGPLARMHRGHIGVLRLDEQQTRTATSVPSSTGAALRQLRAEEGRLQRELARAAVEAQSGALARLLASMSAAVAQHVAVLPDNPSPGGQQ